MATFNLNLGINVDLNTLFQQIGESLPSSYKSELIDNGEGRWVSCQSNGKVMSACYHKNKEHSATVETGGQGPFYTCQKSTAGPGEWAVAIVGSRGWDRTHYDFW